MKPSAAGKGDDCRIANFKQYRDNHDAIFKKKKGQCADCKFSMKLEHRYDQVRCTNDDSREAWGDVEATDSCDLFQSKE